MGVVLGKPSDPQQSVEDTGAFVAINRSHLGPAQGEIPIAPSLGFVHHHVEGAVHRFELILDIVKLHGWEHVVFIKRGMATGFPEFQLGDLGGVQEAVTPSKVLIHPEIFDLPTDEGAFGKPHDEARPDIVGDQEEFQVLSEATVVTFLGLFKKGQMGFQGLLIEKGRAVDPLHREVSLFSLPVGGGGGENLEMPYLAGGGHVGTPTEIGESSLFVEGDNIALHLFLDEFDLEVLLS
ncbi:MAG: hypothetical protein BWY86_01261 [Candidatus Aminicenantes bacterium ADurb.Bin508]|nr:MAG: hypothetical protein BWY86_01261 [Candidatus Aminicenantes bacterium ADurb.Bin508]